MVLCLSILALPKKITLIFVFIGVLIVKSPYMVLALLVLLTKKAFISFQKKNISRILLLSVVLLFPVVSIMYSRIIDILVGEDSSFLSRVDAFYLLIESKYLLHGAWFRSNHLVSDIGLFAEVFFQFGIFFGTIISLIIAFNSFILLIVKLKAFVGFLPLFIVYRFNFKSTVSIT